MMISNKPARTLKQILRDFSYNILFCIIIALFLKWINFADAGFIEYLIVSLSIGLTIHSLIMISSFFFGFSPLSMLFSSVIAIIIGTAVGWLIGSAIIGRIHWISLFEKGLFNVMILGIIFGTVIVYFFFSRYSISEKETLIQEERIKRLTSEKKTIETELRLLQAQIEPHFLFNTLSNILSLIDTDLETGKSMLVNLMQYLRTTLSKTRQDTSTIGREMELISAYLNIFKIRMGQRLRFKMDIPEKITNLAFPPMLIQPLVENAIKHGLEPEIEGGGILIRGEIAGDRIRIEITDTGHGFYENSDPGMGIENIRQRLQSLFGGRGRLILEENRPSGLKAIIEVPYEPDQGDHS